MKQLLIVSFLLIVLFSSCNKKTAPNDTLNTLAEKYVRLGLTIGQYDDVFVDAYYGPDSLKPTAAAALEMPKDSLLKAVENLKQEFIFFATQPELHDTLKLRANWIAGQLVAFGRRIKIFSGELDSFDKEAEEIFGVKVPVNNEAYFKKLVGQLDSILPGKGTIPDRVQNISNKFIIPGDKVDTVFKIAIAEAKKRTKAFISFPENESFTLEYVQDKPWGGYNWYKGNYKSVIQINIDLPILIDRAIDLGCHEGYPGHHVYNMLLEKNLFRDKGWVENSIYPLFSPQSIIAEGSANYGIEMAFPGTEKNTFCKNVLLPLAGLDTANIDLYFKVNELRGALNYARNEAARGLLNKTMEEKEVLRWLTEYSLMSAESAKKSIRFMEKNRSYVICYNYGQDLIKTYIESNGGNAAAPEKRWELFEWILKNQVIPADLVKKK